MKKVKAIFKKKKILFGLLSASVLSAPLFLSSCSSTELQKVINNTVSKGDGLNLTSNLSLNEAISNALQNSSGYESFLESVTGALALQWMEYSANQDNQVQYRNSLNEKRRTINEEYKDLVDKYKKDYKTNWEIYFQQKELDPNGGTESSWKDKKMTEWAKTELTTKLFTDNYFTLVSNDGSKVENHPSPATIIKVLEGSNSANNSAKTSTGSEYKFGFSELATNSSRYDVTHSDIQYAKFQSFVFNKWVETENPFVINMSLWKYGTPSTTNGISDYYNIEKTQEDNSGSTDDGSSSQSSASVKSFTPITKDSSADDGSGSDDDSSSSTTPSSGSYNFPYFQEPTTNDNTSTTIKYKNFVTAAKAKNNFEINTTLGLKLINKEYTEDSSTFILAKNGSIYNDLYIEFAAASSYLYGSGLNNITSSTPTTKSASSTSSVVTKKNISKSITPTTVSDLGLDIITKEFVSNSSFKTATTTIATTDLSANASDINETKISKDLVKEIIKDDVKNPLKKIVDKNSDIYTIDAFQVANTELNKFMMLRNEAGVHAISIDGDTYINKATTIEDAKKRAGDIVMYHAMMGRDNSIVNEGFTIDLKNELSTYFNSNTNALILEYALKTYNTQNNDSSQDLTKQQMFDLEKLFGDKKESYKNVFDALYKYINNLKIENRQIEYITKMVDAKSKFSSNYGVDAYKNGFASKWIYSLGNTNHLKILNHYYGYELTNVIKNDQNTDTLLTTYKTSVTNLITNVTVNKLNSSFAGFKYSEYIYTNNKYFNAALDGYLNNGNNAANEVKSKILKNYIGNDFFDFTTLSFKKSNLVSDTDKTKLDSAFVNYVLSQEFTDKSNKWLNLNATVTTTSNSTDTNDSKTTSGTTFTISDGTIDKASLEKYKKELYLSKNKNTTNSTYSTNYLSLLTSVATVKFLLEDNSKQLLEYLKTKIVYGQNAFIVWQNSQNKYLTTSAKTTVSDLLKADKINLNLDNNFLSNYTNQTDTTAILKNNDSNSVFGYDSSYYSVVSNLVGYKGIQTNSVNSLNSTMIEYLFTNDRLNNGNAIGALYGYQSKEDIKNYINSVSTSAGLETIANDLASKIKNLDLSTYNDTTLSLQQKKDELVNIIEKAQITTDMFKARRTIISNADDKLITSKDSPYIESGAVAIQLNQKDLLSKTALINSLKLDQSTTTQNKSDQSSTSSITIDGTEVFYNLLVEAAQNADIQKKVINKISTSNKVSVFDKRVNNSLDSYWLNNWKSKE